MSRSAASPSEDRTAVYLRKREAVLAAAARVFNQKGLKGATLADVAEIVGLSGNSITYYYRFKEDLALDCYLRTLDELDRLVVRAGREDGIEARVRSFFAGWFALLQDIAEGRREELINFYDIAALSRGKFEVVNHRFVRLSRHVRDLVHGDTRPERHARHARSHLLLSVAFGARNWVGRYDTEDYARAASRTADILLGGVMAGKRTLPETVLAIAGNGERRGHSRVPSCARRRR